MAQLRHVLSAVWSEKAAIENQKNIFFALKIFQVYFSPVEIWSVKIGAGLLSSALLILE